MQYIYALLMLMLHDAPQSVALGHFGNLPNDCTRGVFAFVRVTLMSDV